MRGAFSILCTAFGHNWEYTDEYANAEGHVQADRICIRCADVELGWTGPTVEAIEDATDYDVPTKDQAYEEVLM